MEFSRETFAAFSDVLAALYTEPNRERRIAYLLAGLRPVFDACRITIDLAEPLRAADAGLNADRGGEILAAPIEGTLLQLTLKRETSFTEHERFLARQLHAHLGAAFGGRGHASAPPRQPAAVPADLRGLGLTARECEVLHWIILGKRDAEIAGIIGAAPRTVNKHVENILAKLGAETRLAASRLAADWLARKAPRS